MRNKKKDAFTLIEVIIVTGILSIFFILAITVTTISLRNMKIQEHKLLATFYAEQLKEWLIFQKESDWNSFKTKTGSYCFNSLNITNWPSNSACSDNDYSLDYYFNRQADLNFNQSNNQMEIVMNVSWKDLNNKIYQVKLPLILSSWEE